MSNVRISPQMIKFGSIGVLNTAVDFAIFHLLANELGVQFYIANIASTAVALLLSFVLNAKYSFKSRVTKRNSLLFVSITLTGLWLLQPVIIALTRPMIEGVFGSVLSDELVLLAAKLVATAASLVWNYLLYKNVVFKNDAHSDISHRQ